ncbi:hypothetical protein GCM10010317_097170 [Streptomyces mirabilis]|nr:hypothetical protein GCM10010317_097170 [Streptomyces mirabilis]
MTARASNAAEQMLLVEFPTYVCVPQTATLDTDIVQVHNYCIKSAAPDDLDGARAMLLATLYRDFDTGTSRTGTATSSTCAPPISYARGTPWSRSASGMALSSRRRRWTPGVRPPESALPRRALPVGRDGAVATGSLPILSRRELPPHDAHATLRSRLGVTEELTRLDANGSAAPALAESWKRESDRSWLFTLRKATFVGRGTATDQPGCGNQLCCQRQDLLSKHDPQRAASRLRDHYRLECIRTG